MDAEIAEVLKAFQTGFARPPDKDAPSRTERARIRRASAFGGRILSAPEICVDRTVPFQDVDLDDYGVLILDLDNALTIKRGAR